MEDKKRSRMPGKTQIQPMSGAQEENRRRASKRRKRKETSPELTPGSAKFTEEDFLDLQVDWVGGRDMEDVFTGTRIA
ncbi:hypothetical protein NDU88_004709 [Pleurodeles waltl]|uniref:Uncharacterized protein n=1 Tax=Pleurodeles waltl TaxID=8319 RepID=A0AAV7LJ34_PLEWA|nr:hypothetical protein NDU88_004709 [Pleurodeles waltl]